MIIKKGDFVRKEKSIYLIKSYEIVENKHIMEYYFKATKQPNAELHKNGIQKIYPHQFSRIKLATNKEIKTLLIKIRKKEPDFDLKSHKNYTNTNDLNEEQKCIELLKQKGYIIYKKV